jgi:CRP-like cAMP-binding protein
MGAASQMRATSELRTRLENQLGELGLPIEFADELVGRYTLVNYSKGAAVFCQGAPADVCFYVITGLVKLYYPRPDGTRLLVKLAGPGDIIGYVNLVDARGRPAQVFEAEALTRSSVALFTREHLLKVLCLLDHESTLRLVERLNTLWSSTVQWLASLLSMSFRERLEVQLNSLAGQFGVRESRGILLSIELVHDDLADMIGSSRPMVSRLIADLMHRGCLFRQGKQFILRQPLDLVADEPRQSLCAEKNDLTASFDRGDPVRRLSAR